MSYGIAQDCQLCLPAYSLNASTANLPTAAAANECSGAPALILYEWQRTVEYKERRKVGKPAWMWLDNPKKHLTMRP